MLRTNVLKLYCSVFTGEIKQVRSGIIQARDKTQIIKAYIHNKWISNCVSTMYSS